MKNLISTYESSKKNLKTTLSADFIDESQLLKILNTLKFNKNFLIKNGNTYDLNEIRKMFKFYEDLLKDSFNENKEKFEIQFKLYTLVIKTFTELCNTFIYDKNKLSIIDDFFQILKESKNILKITVPLDLKHINILNNLIGEQLYYFSHIHYHNINDYTLDYTFEKYLLNLEKMFHGYDLSLASNFGHKEFTTKEIELSILKNNASFLILTLIFKIYTFKTYECFNNSKFINIFNFYMENFYQKNKKYKFKVDEFKRLLLKDFFNSAKYIKTTINHNLIKDKLSLLKLDIDEYKQFIDIILKNNSQD